MAPVSSLQAQSLLHPLFHHSTSLLPHQTGWKKSQNQIIVCGSMSNHQNANLSIAIKDQSQFQRRDMLLHSVFAALSVPAIVPLASSAEDVPDDFRIYTDEVNKFKIMIPRGDDFVSTSSCCSTSSNQKVKIFAFKDTAPLLHLLDPNKPKHTDWQKGEGDGATFKSVTAFYPEEASNSNVSIVITGLGADFTKLESFGKVDEFAENLVSGLDRSWQKPPGVKAKLVDSKSSKGLYYIEYTLKNPGESERHLFSVLGVANNGWYNRLYTLTGQFIEEEAEKYGSKIEKAVASFRLT